MYCCHSCRGDAGSHCKVYNYYDDLHCNDEAGDDDDDAAAGAASADARRTTNEHTTNDDDDKVLILLVAMMIMVQFLDLRCIRRKKTRTESSMPMLRPVELECGKYHQVQQNHLAQATLPGIQ